MRNLVFAAAGLAGAVSFVQPAPAATFNVLYSFCQGTNFLCPAGKTATSGLVADAKGNLYGTTSEGGNDSHSGVIFQLSRNGTEWKYKVLHSFNCGETCVEGGVPAAPMIVDKDGNLYGTALQGGTNFGGTAFKLTHNGGNSWTYSVLTSFCPETGAGCVQGQVPQTGLTYAGASSGAAYDGVSPLYGATLLAGASGAGEVYELTHDGDQWSGRALYSFCHQENCTDGQFPVGQIQVDAQGKTLYGVTNGGGTPNGAGVAYKVSIATGAETVLHDFCSKANCTDGSGGQGGVTLGEGKTLLGTTPLGGRHNGGTYFTLNTATGKESVVYSFCKDATCTDGQGPDSAPVVTGAGVVGTASSGGANANGAIFQVGPGKAETVLHSFCQEADCTDGSTPVGGVLAGSDGTLYGVTQRGGKKNDGVIYALTP